VEINTIVQALRKEGRSVLAEGNGNIVELVVPDHWDALRDKQDGIFLIFELFQIRSIALPFSEVSLDIVELATKPIIYHTPANASLKNAPLTSGTVRFSLIRNGFWSQLLFNFGRPLIYQHAEEDGGALDRTSEKFPLLDVGVKEMFLGPEGEVKILKG
jgi:hypothetical protein